MPSVKVKALTKRDLIEELSRKTVLPKKEMQRFLALFTSLIAETLSKGGKVQLFSFGTFLTFQRKERKVRNPRTGESATIKAGRIPCFRPGKMLRKGVS